MKRLDNQWVVIALAVAVAVLATLLAVRVLGGDSSRVWAEGEMRADYMIGLVGPLDKPWVPLFLIDTKRQKVMVYDYETAQRKFRFRATRSFRYDRELDDYEATGKDRYKGPSVEDIRELVEEQDKRRSKKKRNRSY